MSDLRNFKIAQIGQSHCSVGASEIVGLAGSKVSGVGTAPILLLRLGLRSGISQHTADDHLIKGFEPFCATELKRTLRGRLTRRDEHHPTRQFFDPSNTIFTRLAPKVTHSVQELLNWSAVVLPTVGILPPQGGPNSTCIASKTDVTIDHLVEQGPLHFFETAPG